MGITKIQNCNNESNDNIDYMMHMSMWIEYFGGLSNVKAMIYIWKVNEPKHGKEEKKLYHVNLEVQVATFPSYITQNNNNNS